MIIGETTLSGECFERQLSLGHSCYVKSAVDTSYFIFVGLSEVSSDGTSGQYYWYVTQKDENAGKDDHWLRSASQTEKLEHALKSTSPLDPKFTEVIRETPASGILQHHMIYRDIEIDELPAGRITLLGDAAHAMSPCRFKYSQLRIPSFYTQNGTSTDFESKFVVRAGYMLFVMPSISQRHSGGLI